MNHHGTLANPPPRLQEKKAAWAAELEGHSVAVESAVLPATGGERRGGYGFNRRGGVGDELVNLSG